MSLTICSPFNSPDSSVTKFSQNNCWYLTNTPLRPADFCSSCIVLKVSLFKIICKTYFLVLLITDELRGGKLADVLTVFTNLFVWSVFWLIYFELTLQYAIFKLERVGLMHIFVILAFSTSTATHFESNNYRGKKWSKEQIDSDLSLRIIKQTQCFICKQSCILQLATVLWPCKGSQAYRSTNPYSVPRAA